MLRKIFMLLLVLALGLIAVSSASAGIDTANGWYEGEEIYYVAGGVEEGVTEKGANQIYLIGGDRLHQAQVVLHIPGEPDYSPHWNANLVKTVGDTTIQDILDAGFGSVLWPEALFDDAQDILDAQEAGLVTIQPLGVVVLCPIISEEGAEAPGNFELPITDPFTESDANGGF